MFSFMITSAGDYHADPGQALDWQTLDQEFSQFALAQLPVAALAVGVPHRRRSQPGPGAQLAGTGKPGHIPDLRQQRHRGQLAGPGQLGERLDSGIGLVRAAICRSAAVIS